MLHRSIVEEEMMAFDQRRVSRNHRAAWGPASAPAKGQVEMDERNERTLRLVPSEPERFFVEPSTLAHTIEHEILPRLVVAHRRQEQSCADARQPTDAERQALLERAAANDIDGAFDVIVRACDNGVPVDTVLVDLLASTARILGTEWEDDSRSFASVTSALGTLQAVVSRLCRTADEGGDAPVALLAPVPGEQHTLGLTIAADFFRRAGLCTHVEFSLTKDELVERARSGVAVLGLALSGQEVVGQLPAVLRSVRGALDKNAVIVLGGPYDENAVCAALQADGFALRSSNDIAPTADIPGETILSGTDVRALTGWLQLRVGASGRNR